MQQDFAADAGRLISDTWDKKSVLDKAYCLAFVVLVIAIFPWPYSYYSMLRVVICGCLYFYFVEARKRDDLNPAWAYGIAGCAFLYNPVVPVHFGAQFVWTAVNAATVYFLFKARLAIEAGSSPSTPPKTTDPYADEIAFAQYLQTLVEEAKRLDGKSSSELHWIELTDFEEGARRAFEDGVDPKLLAEAILRNGPPKPSDIS